MKKVLVCILSVLMVFALFAACGKTGGNPEPSGDAPAADDAAFKTIGEALADLEGSVQFATYEKAYVCAFEKDGVYWRLISEITPEQKEALDALDIMDEDYEEKNTQLLNTFTVTKSENLTGEALSAEQMAALAGKTGGDLLDDGWTLGGYYDLYEMKFGLEYSVFEYEVIFEAEEELENTDDFDAEAAIRPLKVKSVTLSDLGYAAVDVPAYYSEPEDDAPAIDYLVLVNKQNKLPEGWEDEIELEDAQNDIPEGVELNEDNDYLATDVFKVETKALEAFRALQADLEEEGIIILLDSTYRSVARQKELWAEFEEKYGLEYTQNTVAVPGTSEHHTGLAIDVCIVKDGVVINENDDMIAERGIFSKLHAKLADYGFILRFPENGKEITGYSYEPWHFRYVDSTEIAHEIMDGGLTLEEYLGAVPETTE